VPRFAQQKTANLQTLRHRSEVVPAVQFGNHGASPSPQRPVCVCTTKRMHFTAESLDTPDAPLPQSDLQLIIGSECRPGTWRGHGLTL
jgi:hypothetical protein